jgi:hypothetical protein
VQAQKPSEGAFSRASAKTLNLTEIVPHCTNASHCTESQESVAPMSILRLLISLNMSRAWIAAFTYMLQKNMNVTMYARKHGIRPRGGQNKEYTGTTRQATIVSPFDDSRYIHWRESLKIA